MPETGKEAWDRQVKPAIERDSDPDFRAAKQVAKAWDHQVAKCCPGTELFLLLSIGNPCLTTLLLRNRRRPDPGK